MPTVTVEGEKSFEVESGKKLVLAIEDAGIDIMHRCGGNARCTTCRVQILAGEAAPMEATEQERLAAACGSEHLIALFGHRIAHQLAHQRMVAQTPHPRCGKAAWSMFFRVHNQLPCFVVSEAVSGTEEKASRARAAPA